MINFPIDLVIPYVDNSKKIWQQNYQDFCLKNGYRERIGLLNSERYRDFGFFVYLLRGVDKYMPFIHNIFLLIQDEDQKPVWISSTNVRVVYHKDFIPEKFLPTYNSTTIEMFLHKIKGLSEHFIYINDDMYPVAPMTAEDFFTDNGEIKICVKEAPFDATMQFTKVCYNCYTKMWAAFKKEPLPNKKYWVPCHEFTPMRRSHLIEAQNKIGIADIHKNISPFRTSNNYNQYIYPLYEICIGNAVSCPPRYNYMNMEDKVDEFLEYFKNPKNKIAVVNDNEKTDVSKWNQEARRVFGDLQKVFPDKCKYEIKTKVTVAICVYNCKDLIERCLKSIPNRPDVQVVLLDDHSTDGTLEIALPLVQQFYNCAAASNPRNMGVGYNRNILVDLARGEYVFFLDGDDYLYTEEFNKVVDKILDNQDIVMLKYTRNDGFTEYPAIYRGCFLKRDKIIDVKFNPLKRCYEDVEFKKALHAHYNDDLNIAQEDYVVYHYNKPRIGSVTWDYRKSKGDPAYQGNEEHWEKYKHGKRG